MLDEETDSAWNSLLSGREEYQVPFLSVFDSKKKKKRGKKLLTVSLSPPAVATETPT